MLRTVLGGIALLLATEFVIREAQGAAPGAPRPQPRLRLGTPRFWHAGATHLVFLPRGDVLASTAPDGSVALWSFPLGVPRGRFQLPPADCPVGDCQVAPTRDGRLLALGERFRVLDLVTGRVIRPPDDRAGEKGARATFAADGRLYAVTDWLRDEIRVWDVNAGRVWHAPFAGEEGGQIALSPDGTLLACASRHASRVELWDVRARKWVGSLRVPVYWGVASLAWAPNGRVLAAGARALNAVILWDTRSRSELRRLGLSDQPLPAEPDQLESHERVRDLAFSPDGDTLVALTPEVHFLAVATGQRLSLASRLEGASACAFSPDGEWMASIRPGLPIRLWKRQPAGGYALADRGVAGVCDVVCSPRGRYAAVVRRDVTLWDLRSGKRLFSDLVQTRLLAPLPTERVAFSGDERLLAVGGEDAVRIWETSTAKLLGRLPVTSGSVHAVSFLPDARTVVVLEQRPRGQDETACVLHRWRPDTGARSEQELPCQDVVFSGSFSGDGRVVLLSEYGVGTASLFDTLSGRALPGLVLTDEANPGRPATFSPDGRVVCVPSPREQPRGSGKHHPERTEVVELWEVASGKKQTTIAGAWAYIEHLCVSPDGRLLAVAGKGGQVDLIDVPSGKRLYRFVAHDGPVGCVRFSPAGDRLFTGGSDTTTAAWCVQALLPGPGRARGNAGGCLATSWSAPGRI